MDDYDAVIYFKTTPLGMKVVMHSPTEDANDPSVQYASLLRMCMETSELQRLMDTVYEVTKCIEDNTDRLHEMEIDIDPDSTIN